MENSSVDALRIQRGATVARRRPLLRRLLWPLVAVALIVGLVVASRLSSSLEVEATSVGQSWPYQAQTVLNATGYVVAQRKAAIATKATGQLEWLGVREGSAVRAGEVIARLESRDVEAQAQEADANVGVARARLTQAEAELKDAEADYRRARELRAQNFVAQAAVDTAEARWRQAVAGVGSARAAVAAGQASARAAWVAVEQTRIRAPFDGVVLTKNANVGDVITPFSSASDSKGAVVTMADMTTLEVEADVSEASLGKIRVGQPCEIQLDAFPDERFRGEVIRLVPTVDRSKASVLTKIRFLDPDPRVLPEMSAKVAFLNRAMAPPERSPRVSVAREALAGAEGARRLFLIDGERVRAQAVTTGVEMGDMLEVHGVEPGTRVVLRPPQALTDGARVQVVTR